MATQVTVTGPEGHTLEISADGKLTLTRPGGVKGQFDDIGDLFGYIDTLMEDAADVREAASAPGFVSLGSGKDKAREALRIALEALDEDEGGDAPDADDDSGSLPRDESGDYVLSEDPGEAAMIAAQVLAEEVANREEDGSFPLLSRRRMAKYQTHADRLQ